MTLVSSLNSLRSTWVSKMHELYNLNFTANGTNVDNWTFEGLVIAVDLFKSIKYSEQEKE